MKKSKNRLFIILFSLVWSILIIANVLTPIRVFSVNENRYLKDFPDFSWQRFVNGDYMSEMDLFIDDQFVLRDNWIGLNVLLERALLKQEINGVYFGKDNYLIERYPSSSVSNELLQENQTYLEVFVQTQSTQLGNDRVKVMLVPTASDILIDILPPLAAHTGFDQLGYIETLKTKLDENVFIDVSQTFFEHDDEQIYYRSDHHWTTFGAFLAYQQWAQASGISAMTESMFEINEVSQDFYGTLHSKVNTKLQADTIDLYYPVIPLEYRVTYNRETVSSSLYDLSKLQTKDQYASFFGGNHSLVEIETSLNTGRKMLVIKDSFANAFVPFVANHFDSTIMVDLRYYHASLEHLIKEEKITDILVLYNVMNFSSDQYLQQLNK